jgi:hypothetical protein
VRDTEVVCESQSFGETKDRVRTLGIRLAPWLSVEQRVWFDEFLVAGELGLALEMLADWLSEESLPVNRQSREEFEHLSTHLGNHDRVMSPLAACPEDRSDP